MPIGGKIGRQHQDREKNMLTFRSNGERIRWTNTTGTAQVAGSVQVIGDRIGILLNDTANGVVGVLDVNDNEHELPAVAAEVVAQGKSAFWNVGVGKVTSTAAGNTAIGYYSKAKTAGQTTACIVQQIPGVATTLNVPADSSVTAAKLAAALQAMLSTASIAFTAPAAHKSTVTITIKDAAGVALAATSGIKVWVGSASMGAPVATNNTLDNVAAGTLLETTTAGCAFRAITEAVGGTYVFDLSNTGAVNRYVMVAVGGRVYASAIIAL